MHESQRLIERKRDVKLENRNDIRKIKSKKTSISRVLRLFNL